MKNSTEHRPFYTFLLCLVLFFLEASYGKCLNFWPKSVCLKMHSELAFGSKSNAIEGLCAFDVTQNIRRMKA